MMNNPEQWQMHHMQSMNYHQQQQMMQQYNNQQVHLPPLLFIVVSLQRVPPNGAVPMVPNGMGMYNNSFYPPCTTAASTSASELASFPEVSQMNHSPVVLPSVNGTGPSAGTPPQFPGQANTTDQVGLIRSSLRIPALAPHPSRSDEHARRRRRDID